MKLIKVRQKFKVSKIENLEFELTKKIKKSNFKIKKGSKIAIAVGSRGIANIDFIIKQLVCHVKELGGFPFIVPAMGSHGGATSLGQIEVLKSLGVSQEKVGAPIISSLEVVELGKSKLGSKVFFDKNSWQSDGVILINRIKPHTDYHGKFESGLVKMSVVGLGKHEGALEIHKYGVDGLKNHIPEVANTILESGKIILGIGLVENRRDETMIIKALKPHQFFSDEPKLLKIAKENMPKLPVDKIDILIVDKVGKDISGTGLDPNIIGRIKIYGVEELQKPNIKNIIIDDISPGSHGNAVGIGLADCITKKLYNKIDFNATYENVITSTFFERAKIPIVAKNIEEAYKIARRSLGDMKFEDERIIRIRDTLHLEEIYVSKAVLNEIENRVEILSSFSAVFDDSRELKEF